MGECKNLAATGREDVALSGRLAICFRGMPSKHPHELGGPLLNLLRAQPPKLIAFPFLSFSFLFSLAKHPLRMIY